MNQLYPIKFKPFIQERIWGGDRLHSVLGKDTKGLKQCGESWELSAVHGHISVVTNGFLKGNNLQELVEVYMGDLVGEEVYERFGDEFPLLIKFIDAEDDLSIQVHPNDEMSKERHNAYGKTEMWYVLEADPGARLNAGFRKQADQSLFLDYLQSGRLEEILNFEQVTSGDVYFIPAGRVHAIGRGILLAEIQQTSDVTYRIYDYGRKDKEGKERELHLDLALDAIDYSVEEKYKTDYQAVKNESTKIVSCPYFTTHILEVSGKVVKDYTWLDSFVIYICVDGDGTLTWEEGKETVKKGETILVPATLGEFTLTSETGNFRLLEVFIESENGD